MTLCIGGRGGGGGGGGESITNFFKKNRSLGDHRPKYFMAQ